MSQIPANPRFNNNYRHYKALIMSHLMPGDTGLEVGPFDRPLVERHESAIQYADVFETEHLRAKCAKLPGHNPDFVVDIDYVLGTRGLSSIGRRFDYIIGSHLIEHTPDMLGWLMQVAAMLRSGGRLFLVVPDRRFTFDYYRPETSLIDLIVRHEERRIRPGFRDILEGRLLSAHGDLAKMRAGVAPPRPQRPVLQVIEQVRNLTKAPYTDVHCNVFTDDSFRLLMLDLKAANLLPFVDAKVFDREEGFVDFAAVLSIATGNDADDR